MVLIDTSVWIEFLKARPTIDVTPLEILIEERRAATCFPIRAELLSGEMSSETRHTIKSALDALPNIDQNWNSLEPWEKIVHLSQRARRNKLRVPGIVDRMILLSAIEKGAMLWTLDLPLRKLASYFDVVFFG